MRSAGSATPAGWRTARENIGEHLVLPGVDYRAVLGLQVQRRLARFALPR
ncbi:hypothetical protein ACFY1B_06975 [Streptomyces mirabilis]